MVRLLRLYKVMFQTSIARTLAYRTSFLVEVIFNSLWLVYFVFIVEVLFGQTESVAGWSKGGAVILVGMWSLWDDLLQMLVGKGMRALSFNIDQGDFDLFLTKPVDTLFLASFRQFDLARFAYAAVDIIIIWYGVALESAALAWEGVWGGALMLGTAFMLGYSLWVMVVTLSFRFIKIENIHDLFHSVMMFARNPVEIFGARLRPVLFTVVPLALIANVPVRVFLGLFEVWHVTLSFSMAILYFVCARWVWVRAIRRYVSASS